MEVESVEVPDEWPADAAERGRVAAFLGRVATHYTWHPAVLDTQFPPEHAAQLRDLARRFAALWPVPDERPAAVAAFVSHFTGDGPAAA